MAALALVLTPATSTLPYGTNVQNNCGWISFWSVEILRLKTISVGAALVCRCHRSTRPPTYASGRTRGPRILGPPDNQS